MSPRRLVVPGLLLVAALTVYWPVLLGGSYAMRDFLVWSLPSRALIREALLEGRLAFWHPYLGLGMPAVAEPVNGVFYPLHLLLLAFPVVTGVNVLYLAHVLIAGGGGYVLGRACGAERWGALAGGLTFMLCGVTTSGWASGIGLLTGAWMPWCAAAAVHLGRTRGPRGIAAMAAALAPTALAGDPFQLLRAGLLCLPFSAGAAADRGRRGAATATLRLAAAGALAVLVVGVTLLPGLSLLGDSERAGGLSIAEAERWSMHPIRLVEMVAPGALGDATDPADYPGSRWVADSRLGPVPWAYSVYLGFAAIGFAPLALRRRGQATRALAFAALGALALGLLLALGRHTPVHALLRALLWPLQFFRYPEKYLDICATAVSALVALGVSGAVRNARSALPWTGGAAAALGVAALVIAALGVPAMPCALAHGAAIGVVAFLALELSRRTRSSRWGGVLLFFVLGADLAVAAKPLLRWSSASALAEPPIVRSTAREGPPPRVYQDPGVDDFPSLPPEQRAVLYARTLRGNLGVLYGVGAVPGYESAFSARWRRVWESVAVRGGRALRLFGVGHVVTRRALADPDLVAAESGGFAVHSVREPLPRAYVVGQSRLLRAREDLAGQLLAEDVVEGRAALVETSSGIVDGAAGRAGRCTISRYERERVDLRCQVDRQGLLVLVEAWAPGWQAKLNGSPVPVLRANGVSRALRVQPGAHVVTFRYLPRTLWPGVAMSLAGLLVMAGLAWYARRAE